MAKQILSRKGTAAAWSAANPVLGAGELGFETDTRKVKFGDGTTVWTGLQYTVLPVTLSGSTLNVGGTTVTLLGAGDIAGKLDVTAKAADASKVNGVAVTGTPAAGQIPVATDGTTAPWTDPPFPTKAAATGTAAGLAIVFGG